MAIRRASEGNSRSTPASNPNSAARPRAKSNAPDESVSKPSSGQARLISAEATRAETQSEANSEANIRPQTLADYIGQTDLKEVLGIAFAAAKGREEPLDHLLFYGPPGLGKTTMALILASEMGVNCKITAAPALERPRDITGLLMNLQAGDILFIDEIHRLNRMTEELLYPAMEDRRLDITIGKGASARTRSLELQPFTLIGATTRVGSLTSPLRDRFGIVQRLRFYDVAELTAIISRSAGVLDVEVDTAGAEEIARRARGTPRVANRLLKRVRDFTQVKALGTITQTVAEQALELFNVDRLGLDWADRLILQTAIEQFDGGPVGLEAIAAATGEDAHTIEDMYEPYLLQIGFLKRTPRGRAVTEAALKHLGYWPFGGTKR
ncbi:MAG: Holliday junction branch migration DNA helicase RuvB [Cyanobacteria bacterium J06641_5]